MKDKDELSIGEKAELERLEKRIEVGLKTFVDVANAFIEIKDNELWREKYDSWEAYCKVKWHLTPRRVNQLLEAHGVVDKLPGKIGTMVPSERAARELAKVPEPEREAVMEEALKSPKVITSSSIVSAKTALQSKALNPGVIGIAVDETGYPLTNAAKRLFERKNEIARVLMEVRRLKDYLLGIEPKDRLWSSLNRQGVEQCLHDLSARIGQCIPYAVCYQCQGRPEIQPDGHCLVCHGRGVVSKFAFESQCPEETKKLRNEAALRYEATYKTAARL